MLYLSRLVGLFRLLAYSTGRYRIRPIRVNHEPYPDYGPERNFTESVCSRRICDGRAGMLKERYDPL